MIQGLFGVRQTTSTTGTGPFILAAPSGQDRGYSSFANGTTALCTRRDSSTPSLFESGDVSVSTVAGVTTLTWVTRRETSNGFGVPVTWSGGTQTVECCPSADSYVHRYNYGSEFSAQGDTFCGNVGSATDGVRGLSGGSDGRVVRYTGSNTLVNAQNTDSIDQLSDLLFRSGGKYYRPGDMVPGLSGLTAGQVLYLGDNSTPFATAAPVVSLTVRQVRLGTCYSTSTFHFTPQPVVSTLDFTASGGSNSQILYHSGGVYVAATSIAGGGGAVADTIARLSYLFARGSDGLIYRPGRLVPFTGVTADTIYYLGTTGALSTTVVTPDSQNVQVMVGIGWASGILLFDPKRPLGNNLGSATAVKIEGGFLKI